MIVVHVILACLRCLKTVSPSDYVSLQNSNTTTRAAPFTVLSFVNRPSSPVPSTKVFLIDKTTSTTTYIYYINTQHYRLSFSYRSPPLELPLSVSPITSWYIRRRSHINVVYAYIQVRCFLIIIGLFFYLLVV